MTLQRIELNVTTGERKVIELTPEEEADALARAAAEAAKPPVVDRRAAALDALLAKAALDQLAPQALKDYVSAKSG